ncbi:hypothetical protein [Streptomyces sp. NPDC090025]|uniref:hypothetical protein n=1 Tax=Streptomyces sp. NPDC090025 TaxID=3365922 RepID=UPI0038354F5B
MPRHTLLLDGELPPRAGDVPAFTRQDLTFSAAVKDRLDGRGARNTRYHLDTTRRRYAAWCKQNGRLAQPTTTTANLAEYFGHLMERGSGKAHAAHVPCSPDSLLAYLTRIVTRVRAWLADLRELREPSATEQNPAGGEAAHLPDKPLFRALTKIGNLKRRTDAKVRKLFLTGRAVNEMVKARAAAAEVSVINGLKVTSHSLRAGPDTGMKQAKVPLAERNTAGDWTPGSTLADDVYNRPDGTIDTSKNDPLDAVPLWGGT